MKRKVALLLIMLMSVLALTGCGGTLETLLKGDSAGGLEEWLGSSTHENESVPVTTNSGSGQTIALYFADPSGKLLVKEERTIPKTLSLAREAINQWLMGPAVKSETIQAAISPNTVLNDINLKEGVLTVDLNNEFTKAYGNVSQEVSVYGLVNTLTQFSTVKQVKIRVNGKVLTQLGNVDLSNLTYKDALVKGTVNQTAPITSQDKKTGQGEGNNSSSVPSPSTINIFSDPAQTI